MQTEVSLAERLQGHVERGRALLEGGGADLSALREGFEHALSASMAIAEAEGPLGTAELVALEGLLVATLRRLPALQAAENDVLLSLVQPAGPALDPTRVRALAETRERCLAAATDLQTGLARAYARSFATA